MQKLGLQLFVMICLFAGAFHSSASAQPLLNDDVALTAQHSLSKAIAPKYEMSDRLIAQTSIKPSTWSLTYPNEYVSFYVNEHSGNVYVDRNGQVTAYSPDKKQLWSKPYALGWTVLGSNDFVYSSDGYTDTTFAINAAGDLQWTYPKRLARLQLASDHSLYGEYYEGGTDYLAKLQANGALLWKTALPENYSMTRPTLDAQNNVYYFDNEHVYKVNSQNGYVSRFYSFSSPIIGMDMKIGADGTLYIVDYDGTVFAIGANQQLKWQRFVTQGLVSITAANDGTIYVKSTSPLATLYALNANGQVKWKLGKYGYNGIAPIVGTDGIVYDSAYVLNNSKVETHVYAVDPLTGKELWQSPVQIGESFNVQLSSHGVYHMTEHALQFIATGIHFEDAQLEAAIREQLNKPTGTITAQDVAAVEVLDIGPKNIKSLEGLQHFKNLKILLVYGNYIKDLRPLQSLTKLEHLDVSYNEITDLTPLKPLTNLVTLEVSKNKVKDITPLVNNKNLQFLDLQSNFIESLAGLDPLVKLKSLFMNYNLLGFSRNVNDTTASTLAPLRNLQQLEILELANTGITSLAGVEQLKALKSLNVAHNDISAITPLNTLPKIEVIDVSNNTIQSLAQFTNRSVKELNIAGNTIQSVQPLKPLANLQTLYVEANPITYISTLDDSPVQIITDQPTSSEDESYKVSPSRVATDPFKKWTVHLSVPVQKQTLTSDNVFVKNSAGQIVATQVQYVEGSKKLVILPPLMGYESMETYTIYIKQVKSLTGKTIAPIEMSFLSHWEWKDDERTAMDLNIWDVLEKTVPVYNFYDKTMKAVEMYQSFMELVHFIKQDTFTEKFLLEKNFTDDGSAGHIMKTVQYVDDQKYLQCVSQNLHIAECFKVLNTHSYHLPNEYTNYVIEDLMQEVDSIKQSIAKENRKDKEEIVLPYPNLQFANDYSYVKGQVKDIVAYQQARKQHPFKYNFWYVWVDDFKIESASGSNMNVGEVTQFSALGYGKFLNKFYSEFDLTHFTDTLWVSHNPDIAIVNENGVVKAKKPGTVKIEVMHNGKPATFTLVVK